MEALNKYALIYTAVSQIPAGRVAKYGDIAGLPGHARLVGYALHALPTDSQTPWHRVINAQGQMVKHSILKTATMERSRRV